MLVHEELGPGLLEHVYKVVLARRLENAGHRVATEVPIPLVVGDLRVERAFVADIIVNDLLLIEVKSLIDLPVVATFQTKTYLRLTGLPLGLLMNFDVPKLYLGLRRVVP